MKGSTRWLEGSVALLAALAFVLALDAWTGETAPIWDGERYFELAQRGYEGRIVAPFAFRPGMPFLARWIAGASGLELETSFKLVGRAAATLLLLCAYGGARALGASVRSGAFLALAVGLTHQHVRLPLFFWSLVDVSAFALVLLAAWLAWKGWTIRAGLVAAAGLLFKEMLLVPWAVGLVEGAVRARRERWRGRWLALVAVAAAGLACFLVPRLLLRIDVSRQWIDPQLRPETLARLWEAPASLERWSTIVTASLSYWMPTLLLLTSARARSAWPELRPHLRSIVLYLGLLFPLVLYGGSNVPVFVSYSVPVQVLVLVQLTRGRVETWEFVLVLACLSVFQRTFATIPDPATQRRAYAFFNGLGTPRADARHLLEAALWVGVLLSARLVAERARARGGR